MDTPATVRIEELGSEASGYREAVDERRRVLHVRGSTPARALLAAGVSSALLSVVVGGAFVVRELRPAVVEEALVIGLFALAVAVLLVVCLVFVPLTLLHAVWRRAQWTRFELFESKLVTEGGPWRPRNVVEPWAARAPIVIARASSWDARLRAWDLLAEREDGRRQRFATLHDESSVAFVLDALRERYRDADTRAARHPFAERFGAMPEDVTCDGDPHDPRGRWDVVVRCAAQHQLHEAYASAMVGTMGGVMAVLGAALLGAGAWLAMQTMAEAGLAALAVVAALPCGAGAWLFLRAAVSDARRWVLRWRGHLMVRLDGDALTISSMPITRSFETRGRVGIVHAPLVAGDVSLVVVQGETRTTIDAPISEEAARYVASLVDARRGRATVTSTDRGASVSRSS